MTIIRKSGLNMSQGIGRMVERLMEGPVTREELIVVSTLHNKTVRSWLATFTDLRLVRRAGQSMPNPGNGVRHILYQWNPQRLPDFVPPPKQTARERQRNLRLRRKEAFSTQLLQLTQ